MTRGVRAPGSPLSFSGPKGTTMCVIETSPLIETRRMTLRAPTDVDAARIAEICSDREVARMTARMPHPYALENAFDWISRAQGQDPRVERSFVLDHEDEGPVGMLSLFPAQADGLGRGPGVELGYCVGRRWWGRGLATEAVQAALGWAKTRWKRRAVQAGHFEDNPASGAVLAKAGFLYTGERRPMFSVARGEEASSRMMVWLA